MTKFENSVQYNTMMFIQRAEQEKRARPFWKEVEEALRDPDRYMEFAGGTLCLQVRRTLFMLRICGLGSVQRAGAPGVLEVKGWKPVTIFHDHINSRVYLPDFITKLVQEIYLKVKGETEYFRDNAKQMEEGLLV